MNMPLSRTEQPVAFTGPAAAIKSEGLQCAAKSAPLSAALATALWLVAMQMMKNAGQSAGAKGGQAAGGALYKPNAAGAGTSPALENPKDASAAGIEATGQGGRCGGGFDFALFAELVRQLCNSSFSCGNPLAGGQEGQEGQDGQEGVPAGFRPQVDPAVEQKRMETIAILGRHEGKFKKAVDGKGIDKLIEDKETPPDLVRALKDMKADPEMMDALDQAKTGKKDGKISAKDINILQGNSANKAFAQQKAEDFEQTYIPSDCKEPNAQPRPITNNDAKRELFRYSDYLPKHVSRENLQKIVDGTAEQGKAPPQLVAAAKFYVDNPAAWEKDTGKGADESIRKDGLCNEFVKTVELTAEEDKTLKVLDENRDVFFGNGNLSDAKLKQLAEDPDKTAEVRDAARALQDKRGSLLYTMLDNGAHGHGGNILHAADDRGISSGDLDRVLKQRNKTIAPAEKTTPAEAAGTAGTSSPSATRASQAAQDMSDGQYNQPDAKKKKGGQLRDIATFFLKAYSAVMNVVSSVLTVVAKIPGLGLIAAPAAMAASGLSGAASVGAAALEGKDTKNAAMMAGVGMAGTAVGLVLPGGGKMVTESAKLGAKEGAKEGGETAAREGAKNAATQGGKTWGQREVATGSGVRNDVLAKEAGKSAGLSVGVTGVTTTATESGFTDAATGNVVNAYHGYQVDPQREPLPQQAPAA